MVKVLLQKGPAPGSILVSTGLVMGILVLAEFAPSMYLNKVWDMVQKNIVKGFCQGSVRNSLAQ
jgi:hypothetical protein